MTHPKSTDLRPVTQTDREAAANFLPARDREAVLAGDFDYLPAVQAFARHRISHASVTREDVARVALERCADIVDRYLYRQHEKVEDVSRIARAALATSPAQAVAPPGWRMVPEEATLDMCDDATKVLIDDGRGGRTALNWEEAAQVWSAMLSAALTTPDEQRGEG